MQENGEQHKKPEDEEKEEDREEETEQDNGGLDGETSDLDEEILLDLEELDEELENESGEDNSEEGISDKPEFEDNSKEKSEENSKILGETEFASIEEETPESAQNEIESPQSEISQSESLESETSESETSESPQPEMDETQLDEAQIQPMSDEEEAHIHLKNVVEGALFVAGRPVSIEELSTKTDIRKRDLEALLDELAMDYLMRPTALEIVHIQDKYSLQIKPEYTPKVKKFASGGLIPDAILKTLTIIALKQPLLKSTLVKLRGSTAYEHVKFLIDRGYIEAIKKGRSAELYTTDQFADTFGLSRDIETLKKQLITQLGVQEN